MPIQLLSAADIRTLGSSLTLNDARSVIKEFIDNALDAQANTVSIEISANTLDVILVKDNGSGIRGEDRQMLCKRGYTSKIRTIQDLDVLGGSSLGFRGEALASVVALSNAVLVTTRIDGEPAGSTSKFGPNGQLLSSATASHPVGTTVRVQDFLKILPVRRQTALKAAAKTLADIKKLLQSYAFARPNVRYFFKVLRAQNDKHKWTYGPTPGSTSLLDTTAKIMGQEVAAQCETRSHKSSEDEDSNIQYIIDAVVARTDEEYKGTGAKSHFISVDGRPVSATCGLFKNFVKLYKGYFSNSVSSIRSTERSMDPFLCLHLKCPPGSYDVNVEPAKDEVLFTESKEVADLLKAFLISVYGDFHSLNRAESLGRPSALEKPSNAFLNHNSDLLFASKGHHSHRPPRCLSTNSPVPDIHGGYAAAQKQPLSEITITAETEGDTLAQDCAPLPCDDRSSTSNPRPYRNMYDYEEDEFSSSSYPHSSEQMFQEDETLGIQDPAISNPWTIAKINAPVSTSKSIHREEVRHQGLINLDSCTRTGLLSRENLSPRSDGSEPTFSPPVYQNPGPPVRRKAPLHRAGTELEDIDSTPESSAHGSSPHHLSTRSTHSARSRPFRLPLSSRQNGLDMFEYSHCQPPDRTRDGEYGLNHAATQSTQLTDPVERSEQQSRSPPNARNPFVPFRTPERPHPLHPPLILTPATSPLSEQQPLDRQLRIESRMQAQFPDQGGQTHATPLARYHQHPLDSPPRLRPSPPSGYNTLKHASLVDVSDLDEIMDFEHRKKAANVQRKNQMKLTHQRFNPGQLAQIQRESCGFNPASSMVISSASTPQTNVEPRTSMREPAAARPSGLQSPRSGYESSGGIADNSTPRSNPHHNRYQAAKLALAQSNAQSPRLASSEPQNRNTTVQGESLAGSKDGTMPALPENDPRARLFRHQRIYSSKTNRTDSDAGVPSHPSNLKIKRAKTSQLPFESIPSGSSLHNVSARLVSPVSLSSLSSSSSLLSNVATINDLEASISQIKRTDTYPDSGVNEIVSWTVHGVEVERWQARLCQLIQEKYVVRLRGGGGGGGDRVEEEHAVKAEDVRARVNLIHVLKGHCDEFDCLTV